MTTNPVCIIDADLGADEPDIEMIVFEAPIPNCTLETSTVKLHTIHCLDVSKWYVAKHATHTELLSSIKSLCDISG